jgi:hypothetical protein
MMRSSVPAPRNVAVLIDSHRWSAEKSRIVVIRSEAKELAVSARRDPSPDSR